MQNSNHHELFSGKDLKQIFFNGFIESSFDIEAENLTIKSEFSNGSFDISFKFTEL